jgi:hypothetical protein
MAVEQPSALYNLEETPDESVDVASRHPQIVAALSALAEVARKDIGDSLQNKSGENVRPCAVVTPAAR